MRDVFIADAVSCSALAFFDTAASGAPHRRFHPRWAGAAIGFPHSAVVILMGAAEVRGH